MSKVFAGMATSLDGYIQSKDKDLSWLNNAMAKDEDYGFEVTSKRTGAYIVGANTYREMAGMGGGGDTTPTYVLTHDKSLKTNKSTRLYSGDPTGLIEKIKLEIDKNKDICVFGGGEVTSQFIELGLLDELTISVIPVLLGDGVPFFTKLKEQKKLELIECKPFKSGIVILEYKT
jgi:dihydrofolate reductase